MHLNDDGLAQYWAVIEAAGVLDLCDRGKVRVLGPDRISFLHSMLTNDVEKLDLLSGRHAAFLTSTGKLVATLHLYKLAEFVLIDIDPSLTTTFMKTLERFIIMDDVVLEDVSPDWGHLSLQGPLSCSIAAEVLETEVPTGELRMVEAVHEGARGWLVRKGSLSMVGRELIFPRSATASLKQALMAGRRLAVAPEVAEVLRVERGTPRFGVDMDGRNYPMEARLDDAISFTKGCYIGQEVVAKATYVGGVNRLLSRLKLDGEKVPSQGSGVFDEHGKTVGSLTSAVFSPRLGQPIAMGYLKRTVAGPGNRFQVELGEDIRVSAESVESFFPE